tara:strand:+ start:5382 stop:5807 length:426 start_codon:yes stop_codon:yes gene_type:complete
MIVLKNTTPQTLKVIPREFVSEFTFSYEDDQTNVATEVAITNATISGNYITWSQSFNPLLVINHFYNVELFSDYAFWNTNYSLWQNWNELWNDDSNFKNVFYRDRIFCTDQIVDQKNGDFYDINKGQFLTTNAGNNDYIVP